MTSTSLPPGYAFDNDSGHAPEQHRCLAAGYDAFTTARLARGRSWAIATSSPRPA
ncbi:hypothetical protein [Streptomyces sp. LN699]|uniref:hypothetical protein n=1 Tax=Streptomyces sp. LN699 TaxID=3112981 RepID=UPI00371B9AB5